MYLSLKTSKQLKEWGCVTVEECDEWDIRQYIEHKDNVHEQEWDLWHRFIIDKIYDLRDIICNGEMAKAFFGEDLARATSYGFLDAFTSHSIVIMDLLQQNNQEEAEKYFLENTIFNPKNK